MKARKLLLLILVMGFGGGVEVAWNVRNHLDIGPAGCRVLRGRFEGPSFPFEAASHTVVPQNATVVVDNAFGGVHMSAGAPGEVRVTLRTVVFLASQEEARRFASEVRLKSSLQGSTLRLTTNRRDLEARNVGFETHLDVQIPPEASVQVTSEHGPVDVTGVVDASAESSYGDLRVEKVGGAAKLKSRHGNVRAADVGGALSLVSRYGDVHVQDVGGRSTLDVEHGDVSVARASGLELELHYGDLTAGTIRGALEVRGQHAGIMASDVSDDASVATSYRDVSVSRIVGGAKLKAEHGAIRAEEVGGALSAETAYGDVAIESIAGPVEVKIAHGGLHAQGLHKGARVETSGDDVEIDGFRGAVEVGAKRGSVHLVPEGPLTDSVAVTTANGGIHLEVTEGSRFDLSASAASGELDVDVPGLAVTESLPLRVIGRVGGGGSLVKLQTDHGDVSLTRRSSSRDE